MTETVQARWLHDQVFLLQDRAGYPIIMTQPGGVLGADLLPLSVIGCALWDIVAILQKQHQQVTAVQAAAESLREDEPPWQFRKIHIHYTFSGSNLDSDQIRRAVRLSEDKYCSTFATLRAAVDLTSDFEITAMPNHPANTLAGAISRTDNDAHDPVLGIVIRFNDALNARQLDAMMALLTEDTVFENTFPPPDGSRYEGKSAVRSFWEDFFRASLASRFEIEEITALGEQCAMRWVYHWASLDESAGHIRGADIYRITNGLIAEKLSYVKG